MKSINFIIKTISYLFQSILVYFFFLIGFIISKGGDNLEKKLRKYSEVIGWTGLSIFSAYVFLTLLGYF